MNYTKPSITLGQTEKPLDVNNSAACIPGLAFAIAYAAAVWDIIGAINYVGVINAVGLAAVSFLLVGTTCFGK